MNKLLVPEWPTFTDVYSFTVSYTHINFSKKLLYNMLLYENFLIFNVLFSESRISGREAAKEIDQLAAIQW